jgi:hypothetical protein
MSIYIYISEEYYGLKKVAKQHNFTFGRVAGPAL